MSEALRGAHLYFDCYAGLAGDMVLGALLDLGVPEEIVANAVDALGLPGVTLRSSRVQRGALVGRRVEVLLRGQPAGDAHGPVMGRGHGHSHGDGHGHGDGHHHRAYSEIRVLIAAKSSARVARHALAIFDRIAAVEARMHGVAVADVAFHELGAADSIADIVGCAAALAWLAPTRVSSRVVPLGGGSVRTAHGLLPVPAPATLGFLTGCSVEAGGVSELTTPTGAAILVAALTGFSPDALPDAPPDTSRFGPMPSGRVLGVGWGAGSRELADRPNLLRVVVLDTAAAIADAPTEVALLEANLDDMSAELLAPLVEALLAAGALDAWLAPIAMKKGRPAHLVSALCAVDRVAAVEEALFRESSTLGVRRSSRSRVVLDRELVTVATELGPVVVKLAGRRDAAGALARIHNATPELEDCRRVATERGLPLRRVYELAAAAAARLLSPPG